MSELSPTAGAAAPAPSPWTAEGRATVALSWPLVLTNLAQVAIMATDVVMMGWIGPRALAAGSLGTNLYFVVFVVGFGLAMATAPLMAQALGRARHAVRDVRRTVRQGLWACAAACLPSWLLLWNAEGVLTAVGQQPDLAAAAGEYLRAMMWGLLPLLGFMVLRCFISALERPRAALVVTVAAIAFNALSNWLLMFGNLGFPALGLTGAGVSSSLSAVLMFAALLAYCLRGRRLRRYALMGRVWVPDWPRFAEVWRLGIPIALAFGFEMLSLNAVVALMGLISAEALAAHAIAMQIASITFMVPLGVSQAATVRVGLAAGRGDPVALSRAGWVALGLGGGFMAAMAALLLAVPGPLIGLFLTGTDAATLRVAELAAVFLAVTAVFQIADGVQIVGQGVLRGLKDARVPMIFAGIGYWVLGLPVGATLAFAAGLGGLGLWIGMATGLGVVAVLLTLRWARREALGLTAGYSTNSAL